MKKTTILIIVVLFIVIGYAAYNTTINIYGNGKLAENLSDFKVYLSNLKVNGKEISGINNTKDEFTINDINGDISVDVINDSTEYDTESYLECVKEDENVGKVWNYDYTGGEQTFTTPVSGTYKLETWGAQGTSNPGTSNKTIGGYGGYSEGKINLNANSNLYIVVGNRADVRGTSYNGGGNGDFPGGGATHIATTSGLLSTLENSKSNILIVSGGGGGDDAALGWETATSPIVSGSGGGYIGNDGPYKPGYGGTQTSGGSGYQNGMFGKGGNSGTGKDSGSGGGGGFFGGGSGSTGAWDCGGGGSGYIGNSLLTEKAMYCYECIESSEISTKTISTSCVNATPTEDCAKQGNGYARITLTSSSTSITTDKLTIKAQESNSPNMKGVSSKSITCKLKVNKISRAKKAYKGPTEWFFDYSGGEQTFIAPTDGIYKLEVWGAQGGGDTSYTGGYGGYSSGNVSLTNGKILYLNIAEKGKYCTGNECIADNTYNGGGYCKSLDNQRAGAISSCGSGGGATHIATESGLLYTLKENKNSLVIVAGGGGGANYCNGFNYANGGHGGGYIGTSAIDIGARDFSINKGLEATGGTQTSGYAFGQGSKYGNSSNTNVGGGSGLYGGKSSGINGAGGGSGYIGNSLLTEKAMYCYNCQESKDISTKTISTTCTSATPKENCSKQGNGYARITLVNVS